MKKIIALSITLLAGPLVSHAATMDSMDMSPDSMNSSDSGSVEKTKSVPQEKRAQMDMGSMDHGSMDMGNMDHGSMDMGSMDHGSMDMGSMDHGSMDMGKMQGGKAPPNARSPDYSQGRDYGSKAPPLMMGNGIMHSALFDQLEISYTDKHSYGKYNFNGWIGDDWNRLALKAEGETKGNNLEDAKTELLWRKPTGIFWNTEVGVRHDSGTEKNQTWLALGINGISPYWIELSGTAYLSQDNRTALRAEATYDWRILQRLILQPNLEADFYSKNDSERKIGKGLSELTAGLRLRYEVTRQFAPYLGFESVKNFGQTANYLKVDGEKTQRNNWVAGIRFWF